MQVVDVVVMYYTAADLKWVAALVCLEVIKAFKCANIVVESGRCMK